MAAFLGLAFLATAAILSIGAGLRSEPSKETRPASRADPIDVGARPIAVVELFTSEGCSSCPPAEAALSELIARDWPGEVIPLAFHVDYWDYLGWPDRFSSVGATARQREYAEAFKTASLYTPQMVVNGRVEFVGSDKSRATDAIKTALALPPAIRVSGEVHQDKPGEPIAVEVKAPGAPQGATVLVAQIESGLVVKVERGENAGRTLRHDAVVRTFTTGKIKDGEASLTTLPAEKAEVGQSGIVIVLQDSQRHVLGAARLQMPTLAKK